MELEKRPDAGTVVGVAKTKLDGKTVYLDILYGNRVILPDGSESRIEPAIYERILNEYLKSGGEEKKAPRPEPEKDPEEKYFRTEEEYGLPEREPLTAEQEEEARRLREDRNSFFYREKEEAAAEEETAAEETEEVLLAADEEDSIPFARLMDPGRGRKDGRLLTGLRIVIGALCLLLLLRKLGIV